MYTNFFQNMKVTMVFFYIEVQLMFGLSSTKVKVTQKN